MMLMMEEVELSVSEHPRLRKSKLKNGVIRHTIPIDQFLNHVPVHTKRQNIRDRPHPEPVVFGQTSQLRDVSETALCVNIVGV